MTAIRWLLIALLLQICVWMVIPGWDDRFNQGWLNEDRTAYFVDQSVRRSLVRSDANSKETSAELVRNQYLRFDLQRRTWKVVSRRETFVEYPGCSKSQRLWELKSPRSGSRTYRAEQFDRDTFQTLAAREFELPSDVDFRQTYPTLHANGFVLNISGQRIDYLDLNNPHSKMESLALRTDSVGSSQLLTDWGDERSLLVETVTEATSARTPADVELLRFNDDGKLEHICSWQTSHSGLSQCWNDVLYTLPVDSLQFEVRSLRTGEVLKRWDHPPRFTPQLISFIRSTSAGPVLEYQLLGGTMCFDLVRGQLLTSTPGLSVHPAGLADGRRVIFQTPTGTEIRDAHSDKVLSSFPFVSFSTCLLDQNSLMVVTKAYGISFHFYDVETGKYRGSYRPFAYVPWLCLALIAIFVAWAGWWIRASVMAGWSPWLDNVLTLWLPCVALVLFASTTWDDNALKRLHHHNELVLGLSTGALTMAAVNAFVGRRSTWWRIAPLLLFEAINVSILWSVPMENAQPWLILWLQHMPLCCLMIYLQVWRMFGLRLLNSQLHHDKPSRDRPTLTDYFVLTLCVAAVLGLVKFASDEIRSSTRELGVGNYLVATLLLVVGTALAFSRTRFWSHAGWGLAGAAGLALLVEAMLRWTLAVPVDRVVQSHEIRVCLAIALGTWVACIPHRWREYRWGRA